MKNILGLSFMFCLLLACSKNEPMLTPNSSEVNLAIGIEKDADLSLVFNTLNSYNFDIRSMHGFIYHSYTPQSYVDILITKLNQKSYIKNGPWKATPHNVYYYYPEDRTRIITRFTDMNRQNQADLFELIDYLNLEAGEGGTKNIRLSVPEGTHHFWKTQLEAIPFVKWTQTFDQVCLSYEPENVNSAIVPTIGNVNETIPILINFTVPNGCGSFGSITASFSGNETNLALESKFEGCVCTTAIVHLQTTYNFTPTSAGLHKINFLQANGDLLSYSIFVQ